MATAAVHGLVPCLCVGVFEFHDNHPQLAGGKKKKERWGKKKFRGKRGVVVLMRDEINCTFVFICILLKFICQKMHNNVAQIQFTVSGVMECVILVSLPATGYRNTTLLLACILVLCALPPLW